jgi:hypothetical protein
MSDYDQIKPRIDMIRGWHFIHRDGCLRKYDYDYKLHVMRTSSGSEVLVGATYSVPGKISPCSNGLHASPTILDALGHAISLNLDGYLCLVELSGDIEYKGFGTKYAARHRKVLGMVPITPVFTAFKQKIAKRLLDKHKVTVEARDKEGQLIECPFKELVMEYKAYHTWKMGVWYCRLKRLIAKHLSDAYFNAYPEHRNLIP